MKLALIKNKILSVSSLIYFILLTLGAMNVATAKQQNIAIFQFTATSMDVVGIENDVVYAVRNELRKKANLSLLNQREMEATLMRNRIVQSFELEQAINAGVALDVNFVVIGTVSRQKGSIVSDIALVATDSQQQIANWSFSFINQQDVLNRGTEIGVAIDTAIQSYLTISSQGSENQDEANWLANMTASVINGQVKLSWQLETFAPESLGFNVFRASEKQGPFSYLTSVIDTEYYDPIQDLNGNVYYQISLLNEAGEEFRSKTITQVAVAVEEVSDLAPPAVLSVTQLIKGIEIEFLPSAQNAEKNITHYQLIRREKGQAWIVVNTIEGPIPDAKSADMQSSSIKQYKIVDLQSEAINGPVEYAVRAVNLDGLGNVSSIYDHSPVIPTELINTGYFGVRQVLLKWKAASSGAGYHLYRRDHQGATEWRRIKTIQGITQTEYIDSEFTADGQRFQYALSVFDRYSSSSMSTAITLSSRGPLPAPLQVKVKSGLARKVQISWQPYDDAALKGYAIFRADYTDQADIRLYKLDEVIDTKANSYVDTSLDADNKDYYYAVAAINLQGSSGELSPVLRASTKPAPKAVLAVNTQIGSEQVRVSWTANAQQRASSYFLERRWQHFQWQALATIDGQSLYYLDSQLLPKGTVEYRVTVIDQDNLQSVAVQSEPVMTQNSVDFIPQPDGILRQVNLAWPAISVADSLQLWRREKGQPWSLITEFEGQTTSYTDKLGLLDDLVYEYKLSIIYQGQVVSESNLISMKTKDIPAPESLIAKSGEAGKLTLTWAATNDPDLKSYLLYRASQLDNFTSYNLIAEIPVVEASTYIDSVDTGGISHGQIYRYAIASRNIYDEVGPIGPSIEAHSKALPNRATDLTVQTKEHQVLLNWKTGAETDLKNALIYRRWKHEVDWSLIAEIDAKLTQYVDLELLPFASFEYKVNLLDKDLLSSEDSDVETGFSPLDIKLTVSKQDLLRQNSINWTNNKQVESYLIQRSENNITWQNIETTNQSHYLDNKNLLDEKRYFYQVTAFHKQQKLGTSNIIEVRTKALPRAPQHFLAVSQQVKKVSLSWTPLNDPDVAGYKVYRLEKDGELEELSTLKVNENSYVDEGGFFSKLEHGSLYQYRISAFNSFKVEGPKSSIIAATTKAIPSKVGGVSVVQENAIAALNWQANLEPDIKHYDIYRGKTCGRERKLATVNSPVLSYIDKNIEADKSYCYYIIAVDTDLLESSPSDQVNILVEDK
ncbi:hypothetical protein [Paraglaciecola sp. L3A3]|uniref:hypothetical protein n=1 Tax=Paraglaciecola sp. L3A3 TaxID=2686358 RepID=UPI00131C96DF|nr:hypothetical protein [Paraglaciecola sp. L3A3]